MGGVVELLLSCADLQFFDGPQRRHVRRHEDDELIAQDSLDGLLGNQVSLVHATEPGNDVCDVWQQLLQVHVDLQPLAPIWCSTFKIGWQTF